MQLIEKELRRQVDLNVNSSKVTLDEIFDNYKALGELPPPVWSWSDIMLENIPEGMPKRNRTFLLFEELRDLDMQWGFLADPGPGVHKCCVRHG